MDLNRLPALRLAVWCTIGIVAGRYSPFSPVITLLMLIGCAVVCIAFSSFVPAHRAYLRLLFFGFLLVVIGCGKFLLDSTVFGRSHISLRCPQPVHGILAGRIGNQPENREGRISFILHAEEMTADSPAAPVTGDVLVTLFPRRENIPETGELRYGDLVALDGTVMIPPGPRNPGDFNYRNYLSLNGIHAVMNVNGSDDIRIVERGAGSFFVSSLILPIREYIHRVVDAHIGGTEGAFLKGLLIGERDEIPREVQASFIDAGVVHVLAVSGLNVAFVALIFVALFSFFPVHRNLKTAGTIGVLLLYMFVTGATPSIVRATLMAVVILIGRMMQRRVPVMNAVAASALVIYGFDTRQLFDVGFQLSYAAVISLIVLYPALSGAIATILGKNRVGRLLTPVANLVAASFAAQAGALPFILQYFGKVSLVSFLANVVVVPAANIALALGLVLIFVNMISVWAAGLYAVVTHLLLKLTLDFITFAAHVRWSVLEVRFMTAWHTAAYFLFAGMLYSLWKGSAGRKTLVGVLIAANAAVIFALATPAPSGDMKITFLDVGQGDATLIEISGKAAVLIDCGGSSANSNAGRGQIVPYLRRAGIDKLDAIILTHNHSDHIGGASSVIESIPVGAIYVNPSSTESKLFSRFSQIAHDKNIPLRSLSEGMKIGFHGAATFYIMHPPRDSALLPGGSDGPAVNNSSIVLRFCCGRSSVLFMGDAGAEIEERLCTYYGDFLRSTIIKVAHHGSREASTGSFLSMVKPEYAVVSVGQNNRFGHPSADVLARYRSDSVRLRRTDEAGAVIFRVTPDSVWEEEWR